MHCLNQKWENHTGDGILIQVKPNKGFDADLCAAIHGIYYISNVYL